MIPTQAAFQAMDKQVQEAQAIILRLELELSELRAWQSVGKDFRHVDQYGVELVATDSALHIARDGRILSVELPPGVRLGFVNTGGQQ